jgi:hypothetical protein
MKTLKSILGICMAAALLACHSKNPGLSGIYVNQAKSEYSVASDTLIITAVSLTEKTYSVERHVSFQKIRNGQKEPVEFKQEKWNATWNSDQQVLAETEYGRQIRLSPDKPGVLLKNTLYQQIR